MENLFLLTSTNTGSNKFSDPIYFFVESSYQHLESQMSIRFLEIELYESQRSRDLSTVNILILFTFLRRRMGDGWNGIHFQENLRSL